MVYILISINMYFTKIKAFFFTGTSKLLLIVALSAPALVKSQSTETGPQQYISLNQAIQLMKTQNPHAKNARLLVEAAETNKASALDFHPTEFVYYNGQLNGAVNDKYFEVNQNFGSPLAHYYKGKINKEALEQAKTHSLLSINELTAQLKSEWFEWVFAQNKLALVENEIKVFEDNLGDAFPDTMPTGNELLTLTMAQTKYGEVQTRKFQADADYKMATNRMKKILFTTDNIAPADTTLEMYAITTKTSGPDKFFPATHLQFYNQHVKLKTQETNYERSRLFPEITAGYFNQQIMGISGLQGFMIGITVPLWFMPQKTKIKQAIIQRNMAQNELDYQSYELELKIENLKTELDKDFVQISFYSENALKQADMLEQSLLSRYKNKEILINEFLIAIRDVYATRLEFLDIVKHYNQVAVELEFLVN